MTSTDDAAATDLLIALGRAFHQAGSPADVVEDVMRGMAATLGVALQVNALPTSLMVAVGPPTAQQLVILRLEPGRLNLRKLAMLNELYDRIRARGIDVDTTLTEIASIDSIVRPRPPFITIAAYALLSLGASILLGGGPREMQVSTLTVLAIGRQLVAGTARLGGVLVTLLSLGCGFALGVAIVGPGLFAAPTLSPVHAPGLMVIPAALFMAAAIAVILRARFQDFGWVCASCVIAIVASQGFARLPGHQVAAFGAAFVVGVLTNLGARYWKIPQAVVLVPGILVLVPGSLSYESILYVFQNDVTNALDIAVDAGLAAILIVAGTLLSQIIVRPASAGAFTR